MTMVGNDSPDIQNAESRVPMKNGDSLQLDMIDVRRDFSEDEIEIRYDAESTPPWYLCIFLGLQQYLTMFSGTAAMPILIAPALCLSVNSIATTEIISTLFFVSGVVTLFQSTVGVRLPIIQGGTITFLLPIYLILALPQWRCPSNLAQDVRANETAGGNSSSQYLDWQYRMREIQGAIIAASVVQVFIGCTGLVGCLLHFIGPLTITPTVSLIGFSLFSTAADICSKQWVIALLTMFLILVFSQCLDRVNIPFFYWSCTKTTCRRTSYPIFKMFPVILAILLSWLVCYIITVSGVTADDPGSAWYNARTDTKMTVISHAKWFRVPYPFQWGLPTFSVESTLGMLAGVLAGIMESVGDYFACARLSGAPSPPTHAINRGVLVEGLGGVMAGMFGSGTGTSSFSENVGAIGITKVGSRRVIQTAGLIMLMLALLGKFGAIFVTIPEPIIGGILMSMFGMIIAVGISNLQFVNLNKSRNLYIFGFSMLFGLSVPQWLIRNPGIINSGVVIVDQVSTVLLSSSMFLGGTLGFILDNLIPGSRADRGIDRWYRSDQEESSLHDLRVSRCYDFPWTRCRNSLHHSKYTRWIPFCPSFTAQNGCLQIIKRKQQSGFD